MNGTLRVERVERLNVAFCVAAIAASLSLFSPVFAASVAAGALLEMVNFRGMITAGRKLFAGSAGSWGAGWGLRFVFLAVGIGTALYVGAHPVGLVIGLSLIMPAAIIEAWQSRPPVLEDAPALPPDDPAWDRWDPWLARERDEDEDEESNW